MEALDTVGLFDERYFMYGEDLDLCTRMWKAGWKVFICPEARVSHVQGTSLKTVRDASVLTAIAQSKELSLRSQLGASYYLATKIIGAGLMCRLAVYSALFLVTKSGHYSGKCSKVRAHLRAMSSGA
jgi:GT2 family glycosyltransferase